MEHTIAIVLHGQNITGFCLLVVLCFGKWSKVAWTQQRSWCETFKCSMFNIIGKQCCTETMCVYLVNHLRLVVKRTCPYIKFLVIKSETYVYMLIN